MVTNHQFWSPNKRGRKHPTTNDDGSLLLFHDSDESLDADIAMEKTMTEMLAKTAATTTTSSATTDSSDEETIESNLIEEEEKKSEKNPTGTTTSNKKEEKKMIRMSIKDMRKSWNNQSSNSDYFLNPSSQGREETSHPMKRLSLLRNNKSNNNSDKKITSSSDDHSDDGHTSSGISDFLEVEETKHGGNDGSSQTHINGQRNSITKKKPAKSLNFVGGIVEGMRQKQQQHKHREKLWDESTGTFEFSFSSDANQDGGFQDFEIDINNNSQSGVGSIGEPSECTWMELDTTSIISASASSLSSFGDDHYDDDDMILTRLQAVTINNTAQHALSESTREQCKRAYLQVCGGTGGEKEESPTHICFDHEDNGDEEESFSSFAEEIFEDEESNDEKDEGPSSFWKLKFEKSNVLTRNPKKKSYNGKEIKPSVAETSDVALKHEEMDNPVSRFKVPSKFAAEEKGGQVNNLSDYLSSKDDGGGGNYSRTGRSDTMSLDRGDRHHGRRRTRPRTPTSLSRSRHSRSSDDKSLGDNSTHSRRSVRTTTRSDSSPERMSRYSSRKRGDNKSLEDRGSGHSRRSFHSRSATSTTSSRSRRGRSSDDNRSMQGSTHSQRSVRRTGITRDDGISSSCHSRRSAARSRTPTSRSTRSARSSDDKSLRSRRSRIGKQKAVNHSLVDYLEQNVDWAECEFPAIKSSANSVTSEALISPSVNDTPKRGLRRFLGSRDMETSSANSVTSEALISPSVNDTPKRGLRPSLGSRSVGSRDMEIEPPSPEREQPKKRLYSRKATKLDMLADIIGTAEDVVDGNDDTKSIGACSRVSTTSSGRTRRKIKYIPAVKMQQQQQIKDSDPVKNTEKKKRSKHQKSRMKKSSSDGDVSCMKKKDASKGSGKTKNKRWETSSSSHSVGAGTSSTPKPQTKLLSASTHSRTTPRGRARQTFIKSPNKLLSSSSTHSRKSHRCRSPGPGLFADQKQIMKTLTDNQKHIVATALYAALADSARGEQKEEDLGVEEAVGAGAEDEKQPL